MTTRRPVSFVNASGELLFGILDEPARARTDIGIVLLSPGVKSRVAPHRLYVKLARRLASRGFKVLRFDFAGLGDSEGMVPERQLADLYRAIQLGRYTNDTLASIEWMRAQGGTERVILGGLCGGAIAGLVAASGSDHVAGLFGLGIPVVLDGTAVDKVAEMSQGQLRSVRRKYRDKVLDPASWLRVLTLRTDFRLAWRSFRGGRPATAPAGSNAAVLGGNGNPKFSLALFAMLARQRPLLMVFSGADRLHWEYLEKFAEPHADVLEPYRDRLEVRVIERANHVLTFDDWQNEFFGHCERWLAGHFPGDA